MPPASTIGPSKNVRTARTNTNGLSQPVWPPAPAVSSTSPSAPAAIARSAWRMLATSAKTSAPASCRGLPAGFAGMKAQPLLDLAEPAIELFRTAAIHRRKRADHAVAAGSYHQFDAGDQKHRRRDQRQAQTTAKARKSVSGWQNVSSRRDALC